MDNATFARPSAVETFRALHKSGCFLLPNPWDIGTAIFLERMGFKALATTSAGFAFSRGKTDEAMGRDEVLANIREIVSATSLPVNADFQNGYADEPEDVAESVKLCLTTGVAGLSIEDNTGREETPLYEKSLAVERIRATRQAIDESNSGVVLTARCEAWLVGQADAFHFALDRLAAYAEAGADCLYAPGVKSPDEISAIVKAVAPKPVNLLVAGFNRELSVAQLTDLGVRRVSVGSALSGVAWGAFLRAARGIAENGTFDSFADAATFAEINGAFAGRSDEESA